MTTALSLDQIDESINGWTPGEPFGITMPEVAELQSLLDSWLDAEGDALIAVRRHIHAHPELSGEEFDTADLVFRHLKEAGLAPEMLPRGNGLICDIPGNGSVPGVVALRADLDALPLADPKPVPYRSTVKNVCHACGHDVHTTILLGAGLVLAKLAERGELPRTVRLIFQPSEEVTPSGAPEVIAAGGLQDVTAIYGLHCNPHLPVGTVGVRSGPFTAAADIVTIRLRGGGGHTARPHLTEDLVHALGRVVVDVPALLNRRTDPRINMSMVFGAAHAGEAANTIPTEGIARATVRVLQREAWHGAQSLVTQLIHDVVASTGAECAVDYRRGHPPIINDQTATAVIAGAARRALGPDRVVEAEVSMGGEDFAFYLEQVPGSMIRLGVGVPGSTARTDIHQAEFDVDERAIGYGVRVMAHTALAGLDLPAF